jgi:hypothetical protein
MSILHSTSEIQEKQCMEVSIGVAIAIGSS